MSEGIISVLLKTFNHEIVVRIFHRNSHMSAYECSRRHMPQDCSYSGYSVACLMTLSLRNWNCVDGDSLVTPPWWMETFWPDWSHAYSAEPWWSDCWPRF